jgi:hypothetical protein
MRCIEQGCTNEATIGAFCEGHVPQTQIMHKGLKDDELQKRNQDKENGRDKKK